MLKFIKNKLICLPAEGIVTGIVSEYKESRVFYILADEARDCSKTDQMPILRM